MRINSTAIPLPIDNIDTDQIIPAKFLKQVNKLGYGKNLFYSWRYLENGDGNPEFILNQPDRASSEILIAGNNFGCGSSREHAAWAIADHGIKAIISSQFADIFKGNAYNNGILPVELEKRWVDQLMQKTFEKADVLIVIDLEDQMISCNSIGLKQSFDIHPFKKQCLLQGMDETQYLINLKPEILAFEAQRGELV
ncbi:3-isopropylmalate dehydratase small subunit [Ekhidna sp.]|uniref:3-isopropylmalate dehydratase small subunit n=1 Tax=Ekhidna sp. TaxID=2608089 RepID=UPI003298AFBE